MTTQTPTSRAGMRDTPVEGGGGNLPVNAGGASNGTVRREDSRRGTENLMGIRNRSYGGVGGRRAQALLLPDSIKRAHYGFNSPRILITFSAKGIFFPEASMPFLTINGRPAQQGTSITTVVMLLISAVLKISANF
jgi:hypothetical protein